MSTAATTGTVTHRIKEIVLTVGAVAGALCFAAGLATVAFGVTPLIVESGSMSPTIKTGALAISHDVSASRLRVGDVVRVQTSPEVSVTHRIVKVTHRGESATLRLKGDANKFADAQVYTVDHAGEVLFSIPFLGRVVAAASGPIGLFVLGGYAAFVAMVLVDERRKRGPRPPADRRTSGGARKSERRGERRLSGERKVALKALAAPMLAGGVAAVCAFPQPTFAAWTDNVAVGTSTLSTYTVPTPGNFRCGLLGLGSVTVAWDAIAAPPSGTVTYTVFYNSGSSSSTTSGTSFQITGASGGNKTAFVRANVNFGSTTWNSANSGTRTYSITLGLLGVCA